MDGDEAAPFQLDTPAYVVTCSAGALRVYAPSSVAEGDRTTLAKAKPESPLTAASVLQACGTCFAAAHEGTGRVTLWTLPQLEPLHVVDLKSTLAIGTGPLPTVVLAADGFVFAAGRSEAAAAMLLEDDADTEQLVEPPQLVMYDVDIAAATQAAEEAALAAATAVAQSPAPGGGSPGVSEAEGSKSRAGIARLGSDPKQMLAETKSFFSKGLKNLKAVAKGETTATSPSSVAVASPAVSPLTPPTPRPTPADLAELFSGEPPSPLGARPQSAKPRATSSSMSADREELLRTPAGGGKAPVGSPASGGGPASGSRPRGGVRTADEIKAHYGRPSRASSEAAGGSDVAATSALMAENRDKLLERGEKLNTLQDKTARMEADAQNFAEMAKQLRKQQESSWFGF